MEFIKSNDTIDELIKIFTHSRTETILRIYVPHGIIFDVNDDEILSLKYNSIIHKYKTHGKSQCLQDQTAEMNVSINVLLMKLLRKTNEYPAYFLTNRSNSSLKFGDKIDPEGKEFSEMENHCNQSCYEKIECYQQHFSTFTDFSRYTGKDKLYHIVIEYSLYSTTIYEIYPKIYFGEYLILMSSILSLWFGFSVVMLTDLVFKLF